MEIADRITKAINLIEAHRKSLPEKSKQKATTLVEYEKAMMIDMLKLKSEGSSITLIKDIARGNCSDQRLACELAESEYKNIIVSIEALKAQLNGWQSLFRFSTEVLLTLVRLSDVKEDRGNYEDEESHENHTGNKRKRVYGMF